MNAFPSLPEMVFFIGLRRRTATLRSLSLMSGWVRISGPEAHLTPHSRTHGCMIL
jgi:hypothetical protein